MRLMVIAVLAMLLFVTTLVYADEGDPVYFPEVNVLNTIEYAEGQTIDISAKVLIGSEVIVDAACGVYVLDEGNNTALQYTTMHYNANIEQSYYYYWIPEPAPESFWEGAWHFFFPTSGTYYAFVNCTSGFLNETILTDVIEIRVVAE